MTRWLFGVGPCLVLSRLEGAWRVGPATSRLRRTNFKLSTGYRH